MALDTIYMLVTPKFVSLVGTFSLCSKIKYLRLYLDAVLVSFFVAVKKIPGKNHLEEEKYILSSQFKRFSP